MPSQFSSGKHAIAECDRCGFRYKLKQLKQLVIKTKNVNILVCNECWEEDQPQLQLGMYPVNDPQAVRNPRPDTSYIVSGDQHGGSRIIQWGWNPVGGSSGYDAGLTPNNLVGQGAVGTVTVTITTPPVLLPIQIYNGTIASVSRSYLTDTLTGVYYDPFFPAGSATPTTTTDSHTLYGAFDLLNYTESYLYIGGFTSTITQSFLSSVTAAGTTFTNADVIGFGLYSSGPGPVYGYVWTFGSRFGFADGVNTPCTIYKSNP